MSSVFFLKFTFKPAFSTSMPSKIGFQDGFHLNYFPNIGEPDQACRLRILPRFD
jgi:hypothetical protein